MDPYEDLLERLARAGLQSFAQVIGEERARAVLAHPHTFEAHPFRRLLVAQHDEHDFAFRARRTTAQGVAALREHCWDAWLDDRLDRASDADHKNADGALAEIRAAGSLLQAELKVAACDTGSAPSPDLSIERGAEPGVVEITSKGMNDGEGARFREHLSAPSTATRGTVTIKEHDVFPAGRPTSGECTAENVAQKIAQLKPGARQAERGKPSILWLDLQSDWWSVADYAIRPLTRSRGELYTCGIWHGFYGRRDLPFFEGHIEKHGGAFDIRRQRFDGMLRQRPEWSAAIVSLPSTTVLFENPWAEVTLGPLLRESLLLLPQIDAISSWASWGTVPLIQSITAEWERLEYIAKRDEAYVRRQFE